MLSKLITFSTFIFVFLTIELFFRIFQSFSKVYIYKVYLNFFIYKELVLIKCNNLLPSVQKLEFFNTISLRNPFK